MRVSRGWLVAAAAAGVVAVAVFGVPWTTVLFAGLMLLCVFGHTAMHGTGRHDDHRDEAARSVTRDGGGACH